MTPGPYEPCTLCRQPVPAGAPACPHCGTLRGNPPGRRVLAIVVGIVGGLFGGTFVGCILMLPLALEATNLGPQLFPHLPTYQATFDGAVIIFAGLAVLAAIVAVFGFVSIRRGQAGVGLFLVTAAIATLLPTSACLLVVTGADTQPHPTPIETTYGTPFPAPSHRH